MKRDNLYESNDNYANFESKKIVPTIIAIVCEVIVAVVSYCVQLKLEESNAEEKVYIITIIVFSAISLLIVLMYYLSYKIQRKKERYPIGDKGEKNIVEENRIIAEVAKKSKRIYEIKQDACAIAKKEIDRLKANQYNYFKINSKLHGWNRWVIIIPIVAFVMIIGLICLLAYLTANSALDIPGLISAALSGIPIGFIMNIGLKNNKELINDNQCLIEKTEEKLAAQSNLLQRINICTTYADLNDAINNDADSNSHLNHTNNTIP